MINDSLKIKSLTYRLKNVLKMKGLKMDNIKLQKIAEQIRFNWEMNIRDESEIQKYARDWGYTFFTAEQFVFDLYLEEYSEKGKPNLFWYGLVDSIAQPMGLLDDLTELDYQLIWGYINQDITEKASANKQFDRIGLWMAENK